MSVDLYRDKYIKYKGQYLNLKNLEGGGEIGEAWYFLLPEHIDELAKIYNANTILGNVDNAPSSDNIEQLLKKNPTLDAYMIKLGDKILKNVVSPGTNQKNVEGGYRLGHIQNDEEKSQANAASKEGKSFLKRFTQSIVNTASTLADKVTPYSTLREKGDMSLVTDKQIGIHITALKKQLPTYKVVHIDFSIKKNKYLPNEYSLKNPSFKVETTTTPENSSFKVETTTTPENPVIARSRKLICNFSP